MHTPSQTRLSPSLVPIITITAVSTLILPLLAQAEVQLPPLVITASRSQEVNNGLAESISVTKDEQVALDQGGHIQDSMRQMAGVTINQLSGSSSHNTAIRMPINYDGYYLFLQDSVPLQSVAFFNHNGLRWSSYNTSAQQIEVLKGAGSTLYGSGAVAATINVLSEEPTAMPAGKLLVQGGENGFGLVRARYSGAIHPQQNMLISGSLLHNDGWRDHTTRDRGELLMKHDWIMDEKNALKTQLQLSRHEDEMAGSLTEAQYREDPKHAGLSHDVLATDPVRESDFVRLSSDWTHFANDQWEVSVIPYLRRNTNDYTATWRSYTPKSESTVDSIGALLKSTYARNNGDEVLVGMDLEHSESDLYSYQPIDVTVKGRRGTTQYIKGFVYRDQTITYHNASPYLQYNLQLSDALQLQAGVRHDYSRFELGNQLAAIDNDGFGNRQLEDRSDSFNSTNPKLGFTWQYNEQSSVYGRLARANRLPTASTLYNLKSGDSGSLVGGVKEEISTTAELGYRLYRDNLAMTLALYRMDIDDAIVRADDAKGDSYRTNAGEVRNEGVEIELHYQLNPHWSFGAAWSHAKHTYIDYVNDGNDYSDKTQALAPKEKGSVTLGWQPNKAVALQLSVDHFGNYWMDDANTRRGEGYTLAHLKGRYQVAKNLTAYGRIENVFDEKYAYQSEVSWGKAKFSPGAPRTVKAGLEYRW